MSRLTLALRSLLWTLLLPGVVAGFIPWRFYGLSHIHLDLTNPLTLLALVLIAAGVALLAACIWDFAAIGRGTLSPLDPPKQLIVQGLYRYVRNPMYLSVSTIVLGEALLAGSRALVVYWGIFFVTANLFVILYEEPRLRRQFGESYERYRQQVGRWLPRMMALLALCLSATALAAHAQQPPRKLPAEKIDTTRVNLDTVHGRVFIKTVVDERPEIISVRPLNYPDLLRESGVEGRVIVEAIIDTSGRIEPESVRIIESSNAGFNQSARSHVLQALFRPARIKGRAVRVLVNLPIDYRIKR